MRCRQCAPPPFRLRRAAAAYRLDQRKAGVPPQVCSSASLGRRAAARCPRMLAGRNCLGRSYAARQQRPGCWRGVCVRSRRRCRGTWCLRPRLPATACTHLGRAGEARRSVRVAGRAAGRSGARVRRAAPAADRPPCNHRPVIPVQVRLETSEVGTRASWHAGHVPSGWLGFGRCMRRLHSPCVDLLLPQGTARATRASAAVPLDRLWRGQQCRVAPRAALGKALPAVAPLSAWRTNAVCNLTRLCRTPPSPRARVGALIVVAGCGALPRRSPRPSRCSRTWSVTSSGQTARSAGARGTRHPAGGMQPDAFRIWHVLIVSQPQRAQSCGKVRERGKSREQRLAAGAHALAGETVLPPVGAPWRALCAGRHSAGLGPRTAAPPSRRRPPQPTPDPPCRSRFSQAAAPLMPQPTLRVLST